MSAIAEPAGPPAVPGPSPPDWRPASLARHWRELRSNRSAWLAVAHNLVPVVGVFLLGWSVPLAVFAFWFDGVAGLAAILAMLVGPAMRDAGMLKRNPLVVAFAAAFTWLLLLGVLGLPYGFALVWLGDILGDPALWQVLRTSPSLWATFAGVLGAHLVTARRRGYGALPERELKQAVRWDAYLLMLRALGMLLLVVPFLPFLVVPTMALLCIYLEVWPARALGLVWGDPNRLHEDPEDRARSGPAAPEPRGASRPRRRRRG